MCANQGNRSARSAVAEFQTEKKTAMRDYIKIARPDHWLKNIFMLPGVFFALIMTKTSIEGHLLNILLALVSLCLTASANYCINEYLDREFDKFHPRKKHRPSVSGRVLGKWVAVEYAILSAAGLLIASLISTQFFIMAALLLLMGIIYNVQPFRSKDKIYLDVLSESLNNPIRLMMGWFVIDTTLLPPVSLIMAYWFGGAFLMAVKRYSEYRYINNPEKAGLYRASFKRYTEQSLLQSLFLYAMFTIFFLSTYLIKYKIEFLIVLPFISGLFVKYLNIGMKADSAAQHPEKLYKERRLLGYVGFIFLLFIGLLYIQIPALHLLLDTNLIPY